MSYGEKIEKVVTNEELSIEEAMKKFEKIHDKIKFRAFGKVTIGGGRLKEKDEEKNEVISAEKRFEEETKKVESEIEEIKKSTNGRIGRVWEIRKRIVGGPKA